MSVGRAGAKADANVYANARHCFCLCVRGYQGWSWPWPHHSSCEVTCRFSSSSLTAADRPEAIIVEVANLTLFQRDFSKLLRNQLPPLVTRKRCVMPNQTKQRHDLHSWTGLPIICITNAVWEDQSISSRQSRMRTEQNANANPINIPVTESASANIG